MGSIEEQQLIENYLSGRLSTEESISFESRMAEDAEFRQRVNTHSSIQELLVDEKTLSFRRLVDDVRHDYEKDNKESSGLKVKRVGSRRIWRQAIAVAATVLILLVPAYWLLFYEESMTAGQIAGEFMEPYPLPGVYRGADEETKLKALEAYESGRYDEAGIYYESLISNEPDNELHLFASGLCYLFDDKPKNAIPIFRKIVEGKNMLIEQQARWYLAMSYLKADDSAMAKKVLERIDVGAYKYAEARKIIDKL